MKIRILINENLKNSDHITTICKTNKYLKSNNENILYFSENNWEKVFNQIVVEMKKEKKFERMIIFAEDGFLPFYFFSKEIGFVTGVPFSIDRAKLCRAHNNANVCIITNNVPKDQIEDLVNSFIETPFDGGRHITRYRLMQDPYKITNVVYRFNPNESKTVVVCSDHAGYAFKEAAKQHLIDRGFKVIDVGCNSLDSTHYPLYAIALVKNANKAGCGIAFCSTGVGMANTINNFKGMSCFMCCLPGQAKKARSEFGANCMALGARFMSYDKCIAAIDSFVDTKCECKPEVRAMNNYGFDLDEEEFTKIPLEKNIEIPKELRK